MPKYYIEPHTLDQKGENKHYLYFSQLALLLECGDEASKVQYRA